MFHLCASLLFSFAGVPSETGLGDLWMDPNDRLFSTRIQRIQMRKLVRAASDLEYNTRDARIRWNDTGTLHEAEMLARTQDPRALKVRLRFRTWGSTQLLDADTTFPPEYKVSDSSQMDLALLFYAEDKAAKALPILQKLAKIGYPEANAQLASLYLRGNAVRKNCDSAVRLASRARDSGEQFGAYMLAEVLADPECHIRGRNPNIMNLLIDAAERGSVAAMRRLAEEFTAGNRTRRDFPLGIFSISFAAMNRDSSCRAELDMLTEKMGREIVENSIAEGRLRLESFHLGLSPLPSKVECVDPDSTRNSLSCDNPRPLRLKATLDDSETILPALESNQIIEAIASKNPWKAATIFQNQLGCLRDEALDMVDVLTVQIPKRKSPIKSHPKGI